MEDYDYDYDGNSTNGTYDPLSYFEWKELLPTLIVYSITFILGLCGNILMIFITLKYRRMKSVTNVFLASLASSDLILIIVCIPVKVAKLFSYTWGMGEIVCKVIHYMQFVSAICSVMTLTAISIERYYAIVHPMKAKYMCTISQAKKIILLIWILSFLLGSPTLQVQIHIPVGPDQMYRYCVRGWEVNTDSTKFHEVYMFVVIFVGPFCIMLLSYSIICYEIWKVMERRLVMTSEEALSRTYVSVNGDERLLEMRISNNVGNKNNRSREDTLMVKQVVCMLVTVVVLFAICWTPFLIDNILTAYGVIHFMKFGTLKYMSNAFSLMAYFNSCINPIIYGFMSKNFRKSFFQALRFNSGKISLDQDSKSSLRNISMRASHTRISSVK